MHLFQIVCCALLVVSGGIAGEIPYSVIKEFFKDCITETGASEAEVENIIKHHPTSSQEGKCLRACIMKKFDTMTPDGKFSEPHLIRVSQIYTKGDAEKVKMAKEIISVCDSVPVTSDHCQNAEDYSSCIQKEGTLRGASFEL